ncbi:MAG: hypothetical protein KDC13_03635 [Bacteroidetes bacterium]|nr:hypothetical protein [Bacteroidota bacterium]
MAKFLFAIFLLPLSLLSQDEFPTAWLGSWKGELEVFPESQSLQHVEVSLEIKKTDIPGTYTWLTVYNSSERRIEKEYLLREIDASRGMFEIDEQDGIILPATLLGNELWSFFSVQGIFLVSVYRFSAEFIEFEIPSALQADEKQSGGQNDSIPAVQSYPVRSLQKTRFRRVEE